MNKGENRNLQMKRICETIKFNRTEDYENIKYVSHDKERPYVAMYAFVQKHLLSKFKYKDILTVIKMLPSRVTSVSFALNYTRKTLNSMLKEGKIYHKDAVKVNMSDILGNILNKK